MVKKMPKAIHVPIFTSIIVDNIASTDVNSDEYRRSVGVGHKKIKLVITILLFRIFYLSLMSTSCYFLPDHNPGNDVVRFDLRLDDFDGCFCRSGNVCDNLRTKYKIDDGSRVEQEEVATHKNRIIKCAVPSENSFESHHPVIPINVWKFILEPFTKWDAARFLNLAVNPSLRDPTTSTMITSSSEEILWETSDSEQAHAFLPLFPFILQNFAFLMYHIVPTQLLPPTFESLVVLSGLLLNNFICLVISTIVLYNLTILVLTKKENSKMLQQQQINDNHFVSTVVCLVYGIWNPAIIFFATNYSESLFNTMALLGYFCMERRTGHDVGDYRKNCGLFLKIITSIIWWLMGICFWMAGSFTRSNGTLHCLWLLQDGLARILLLLRNRTKQPSPKTALGNLSCVSTIVIIGIHSFLGIFLVAAPIRYHDYTGWKRHCSDVKFRPLWCQYTEEDSSILNSTFSLYRYIQNKHWNVGLFRYYEWKQVPNFILAAPILGLSALGVYRWIYFSLVSDYGRGKTPTSLKMILVGWPLHALSKSVLQDGKTCNSASISLSPRDRLVDNKYLLGHYAILAILVVIGAIFAHVQISTRMIISTSPAIIWFIAYCLLTPLPATSYIPPQSKHDMSSQLPYLVWLYTVLYMVLGVILHVNFLPWT